MAETIFTLEATITGAADMSEVVAEVGAIFDAGAPYELEGTPPDPVTVRQDWDHTKAKDQWEAKAQRVNELEAELATVLEWKAHLEEGQRLLGL